MEPSFRSLSNPIGRSPLVAAYPHTLQHAVFISISLFLFFFSIAAFGHDVSPQDRALISDRTGLQLGLYLWLGAKHMVTGYDHLLFLVGVVFYLRKISQVAVFVSLFALAHTLTLMGGVLLGLNVNAFVVDAIVGLSVAYKGFDNLGGFQKLFGEVPDERFAVFIFGLFHGLGLATKLQDLGLREEGVVGNLIAFNVGVELGQFAALVAIIFALKVFVWGAVGRLGRLLVNGGLVVAGFSLMAYQIALFIAV